MGRKKTNQDELLPNRVPSTCSMLTRKSKSLQQIENVNAVFNNPLLMDKIIKYSIYTSNGKRINVQTSSAIRLVNKSFLQSASRTLKMSGDWIIRLVIGDRYEMPQWPCNIGDILNKFISVFSKTSRSTDSILPVYSRIEQRYLTNENCTKLRKLFEKCSDIFSLLSVTYPLDGGSLQLKCNCFTFTILQGFVFRFETWRDPVTNRPLDPISKSNARGLTFLQQVLHNSPNLQKFTLTNFDEATVNTSSISLPATLKTFKLNSPLTINALTLLTKNQLPNLKVLDITAEKNMNLMYKILEHFRQQLTILFVDFMSTDEESQIHVKFPLMEKLTYLKLCGEDYALCPQLRNVWLKLVPNLTRLVFKELPEPTFLEWIQGSRFENVKKLKFSLNRPDEDEDYPTTLSPSVVIITEISTLFRNIQKLTLKYSLNDISSLKYLFKNIPHLRKLNLHFDGDERDSSPPGYKLVSSFLGISLELAVAMIDKTAKNVNVAVDNPESIMNLTELNSLTLRSPLPYSYADVSERCRSHLYSGIISRHGFDKMPKLQKIKLLGGFELPQ